MRLLGFLVISLALYGGLFFSASTDVHAQVASTTQTTPAGGTFDYFYSQGTTLIGGALNNLTTRNELAESGDLNPHIRVVRAMLTEYTTIFNANRTTGVTPARAQELALVATERKRLEEWNRLTAAEKRNPVAQAVNSTLARQLSNALTQALQIQRGSITASSTEADSLVNAGAPGRAGTPAESDGCSLFGWSIIDCIDEAFAWIIKNTLLQIAGFFLWLTANMFNYAVQIGILNFSQWAPISLYPIWLVVRQIVSLAIVFVGLYLGFMYILGKEDKFARYIPWVVIFALFINFSYPLTRTAIDVSNIVSLNIYASAVGNDALTAGVSSPNTAGALIMTRLGLQGLILSATAVEESRVEGSNENMLGNVRSVPGALLAVVYVLYAAYIFFMVTGIILMRTVSLVFLTITSPILFIDSVLPLLGDKAQMLRKVFFEQLAVGPVFMIMLALTLKFLEVFSAGPLSSGAVLQSTGAGNGATVSTFFNILMMLIMLHIMIKVTKNVSGTIGQYATDAMGKVGGFGLGVASAGTGLLARSTIGAAAAKMRDHSWVANNQTNFVGRRAYDLSNSLAKSTFDARNSKTVSSTLGKVGLGMGMGAKLGYEQRAEERKREILERGSRIKTRYERDVLVDKKDANGKLVLDENNKPVKEVLHRKGDVDVEGEKAAQKYTATAGGSVFMSKGQKERVKLALADQQNKKGEERIQLTKTNATKEFTTYSNIKDDLNDENKDGLGKTEKERKDNFVAGLNKDLETLKKTDPTLSSDRAQELSETLRLIREKEKNERDAFDKELRDTLYVYSKKKGEDQEKYLSSQKRAIQEAVKGLNSAKAAGATMGSMDFMKTSTTAGTPTPIDIDVSAPAPQTIVADVHVENFAEKMAVKRKLAQMTAAGAAEQEMIRNKKASEASAQIAQTVADQAIQKAQTQAVSTPSAQTTPTSQQSAPAPVNTATVLPTRPKEQPLNTLPSRPVIEPVGSNGTIPETPVSGTV